MRFYSLERRFFFFIRVALARNRRQNTLLEREKYTTRSDYTLPCGSTRGKANLFKVRSGGKDNRKNGTERMKNLQIMRFFFIANKTISWHTVGIMRKGVKFP